MDNREFIDKITQYIDDSIDERMSESITRKKKPQSEKRLEVLKKAREAKALKRKEKEVQKTEEEMYEKFKERLNNETVKPEEEQGRVDPQEQERQRKLQARKRAIFGL